MSVRAPASNPWHWLLPWKRRQPPAADAADFDVRAELGRISTGVLQRAAQLLQAAPGERGSAEAQVQAFCNALVAATPHLRLAWLWFGPPDARVIVPAVVAGPAAALARGLVIEHRLLTRLGPAFRALRGQPAQPFNVSTQSLYRPWRDAAAVHGVRNVVALPLASTLDERRGLLVLYADVPDYFERLGVPLFDALATLVSAVLSQSTRQQQLEQAARTDALTGLANRARAETMLGALVQQPPMAPLSLLLLDIDHFKRVNDTHGHAAGDAVLRSCAQRLAEALRGSDGIARWGGEEFLVWLPCTPLGGALAVAEKLREAVAGAPHALPGGGTRGAGLQVTVSIGLARRREGEAVAEAIARADRALYAAKRGGRNRVQALEEGAAAAP